MRAVKGDKFRSGDNIKCIVGKKMGNFGRFQGQSTLNARVYLQHSVCLYISAKFFERCFLFFTVIPL
jgi:hypothetical protein